MEIDLERGVEGKIQGLILCLPLGLGFISDFRMRFQRFPNALSVVGTLRLCPDARSNRVATDAEGTNNRERNGQSGSRRDELNEIGPIRLNEGSSTNRGFLTPYEAREVAAALLLAADEVESSKLKGGQQCLNTR
jgi:hypothetical protein